MSIAMAKPWYREPWPWLLMVMPAAAVIGGIVTAMLAFRSADGVVAADYYKRGLGISEELSRKQLAAALGIEAQLRVAGIEPGDFVAVRLTAAQPLPPAAALRVRLVHPGRSGADRTAVLARTEVADAGRTAEYAGSWGEAGPVARQPVWRIVVETAQWRIDGDARIEEGRPAQPIRLQASR